jgi:hypothetical protein
LSTGVGVAITVAVTVAVVVAAVIADGDINPSSPDNKFDKHPAREKGGGGVVDMTFCYHDERRHVQRTALYMNENSRIHVHSLRSFRPPSRLVSTEAVTNVDLTKMW